MSQKQNEGTEQKRAMAVIELAKGFIGPAIQAQGPLPANADQAAVAAYFDRACNISISLAGLFRRKSIELVESAKKMDEAAASKDAGTN